MSIYYRTYGDYCFGRQCTSTEYRDFHERQQELQQLDLNEPPKEYLVDHEDVVSAAPSSPLKSPCWCCPRSTWTLWHLRVICAQCGERFNTEVYTDVDKEPKDKHYRCERCCSAEGEKPKLPRAHTCGRFQDPPVAKSLWERIRSLFKRRQ